MNGEVYTRQQRWGTYEQKEAEMGGTLPISTLPNAKPDPGAKHVIPKTANLLTGKTLSSGETSSSDLVVKDEVPGEQPERNAQAQPISPRVDVSGKEPPKLITEKQAQHLAMPSIGRYPLDSYSDVEKAAAYFGEHSGDFSPAHSREVCLNLTKRASALGIEVSGDIQKLGGEDYAPAHELEIAFSSRRMVLDEDACLVLNKLAEERVLLEPGTFAVVLGEFDKMAGIDHLYGSDVVDPYRSTFGKEAMEDNESHVIGNDIVSDKQLLTLGRSPARELVEQFGEDFVEEFKKDPIGIFNSLPVDQKKVLSRHANEPVVVD